MSRRLFGTYLLLAAGLAALGIGALDAGPADLMQGRVIDANGEPVADAQITLRSRAGPCFLVPQSGQRWGTDADGRFELPFPNEPMQVRVDHGELSSAWATAQDGMTVRLEQPAYVECDLPAQATVSVRRGAELLAQQSGVGVVRLGPLPPYEHLTVSVTSPDARPTQLAARLRPGETRSTRITLDEALSVSGQLSEPLADVAIRASQGDGRDCVVRTQSDGSFVVKGLHEGAVRLIVLVPDRPVQMVTTAAGSSIDVEVVR